MTLEETIERTKIDYYTQENGRPVNPYDIQKGLLERYPKLGESSNFVTNPKILPEGVPVIGNPSELIDATQSITNYPAIKQM